MGKKCKKNPADQEEDAFESDTAIAIELSLETNNVEFSNKSDQTLNIEIVTDSTDNMPESSKVSESACEDPDGATEDEYVSLSEAILKTRTEKQVNTDAIDVDKIPEKTVEQLKEVVKQEHLSEALLNESSEGTGMVSLPMDSFLETIITEDPVVSKLNHMMDTFTAKCSNDRVKLELLENVKNSFKGGNDIKESSNMVENEKEASSVKNSVEKSVTIEENIEESSTVSETSTNEDLLNQSGIDT